MSMAPEVVREQILAALSVDQIYGGKVELLSHGSKDHKARCPFHADKTPSFFIYGDKRFHCFGCGKDGGPLDFVMLMYGLDFRGAVAHLAALAGISLNGKTPSSSRKSGQREQFVAAYDYVDEHGKLQYQVLRYEPKNFKQRRPDGKGGWIWNLDGVKRVLYRLPEVITATDVLVLEGEKDVKRAHSEGICATTGGGASSPWLPEYTTALSGKNIAVIADADEPGREKARTITQALLGNAKSVRMLEMPEAKKKGGTSPIGLRRVARGND